MNVENEKRICSAGCSCTIHAAMEEGATRGTTALVYYQLHSNLYTGTVQGY
jgi:hypothetical protein